MRAANMNFPDDLLVFGGLLAARNSTLGAHNLSGSPIDLDFLTSWGLLARYRSAGLIDRDF